LKEKTGGVPFICVGFDGWRDVQTVRERAQSISGSVLVLRDPIIYSGVGGSATGPLALLMFLGHVSALIQKASVTMFPAWEYGLMSKLRKEQPALFAEEKQSSPPDKRS
jgi:hypothetical protein